ncbi:MULTISPECIES: hypothetical protein [unclassified Frigoribacterium]|uniref:hypothetical protein n=1 Tax=unclassified Frigoribacterium TaxID=2627005 RepID=UPI001563AFDB|nr:MULTISPECIES: hypothetical protein [unclassified Frigoribacterium]NQW87509.1 hypothetical protein [Frigoribacterium sp. VKM Ac-2860]NQX09682.1 hypothetical protein [Frigoribacterium sp. VKM Ac-2859]
MNPAWIHALELAANASSGLQCVPEPEAREVSTTAADGLDSGTQSGRRHHLVCDFRQLDRPTSRPDGSIWTSFGLFNLINALIWFGVLRLVLSIATLGIDVVIWRMALNVPQRAREGPGEEVREDETEDVEAWRARTVPTQKPDRSEPLGLLLFVLPIRSESSEHRYCTAASSC